MEEVTENDPTLRWIRNNILMVCMTKKLNKSIANQKNTSSKIISNAISWTHKLEEHMSERMMCLGFRLQTGIQSGKKLAMDFQNGLDVGKQDLRERKRQYLRKITKNKYFRPHSHISTLTGNYFKESSFIFTRAAL